MSRKLAIERMCRQCIYDPHAGGTWRQQTEECPSTTCPLWRYRPRSASPRAPRAPIDAGKPADPGAGIDDLL